MFNTDYFKKVCSSLIDNIPLNKYKNRPLKIKLVLDGGAFNGSNLIGAFYFLKELEKRQILIIEKVSGCSAGCILGFLYLIDRLDIAVNSYKNVISNLNNTTTIDLNTLITHTLSELYKTYHETESDTDKKKNNYDNVNTKLLQILNNRFYVTYHNIKLNKKRIKYKYKNIEDVMETINRSCFIPFFTNKTFLCKGKYFDGIMPYFFENENRGITKNNSNPSTKILYLRLTNISQLSTIFFVNCEKNNSERILKGMLDIHQFFITNNKTVMCQYLEQFSTSDLIYQQIKRFCEKVIITLMCAIYNFSFMIPNDLHKNVIYKILSSNIRNTFEILIRESISNSCY